MIPKNVVLIIVLAIATVAFVPVKCLPDCGNRTDERKQNYEEHIVQKIVVDIGCSVVNNFRQAKDYVKSKVPGIFESSETPADSIDERSGTAKLSQSNQKKESEFMIHSDGGSRLLSEKAMQENSRSTIDNNHNRNLDNDSYDDGRITFPKDDETVNDAGKFGGASQLPSPAMNISLDDRAALNAPITCDVPGQVRDSNGICRTPTKLHLRKRSDKRL